MSCSTSKVSPQTCSKITQCLKDAKPLIRELRLRNADNLLRLFQKLAPVWASQFPEHQHVISAFVQDFDMVYQKYSSRIDSSFLLSKLSQLKLALESGFPDNASKQAGRIFERPVRHFFNIFSDIISHVQSHQAGTKFEHDLALKYCGDTLLEKPLEFRQEIERNWEITWKELHKSLWEDIEDINVKGSK